MGFMICSISPRPPAIDLATSIENQKVNLARPRLNADEFISRFLLHVLPSRYVRIRHFGLLANRTRKDNITACRKIIGGGKPILKENVRQETWQEQLLRICGIDVTTCPVCQKGRMFRVALLFPYRCNSPPEFFR
jgi:hypothetical protein